VSETKGKSNFGRRLKTFNGSSTSVRFPSDVQSEKEQIQKVALGNKTRIKVSTTSDYRGTPVLWEKKP